jgi:hypothetical protein
MGEAEIGVGDGLTYNSLFEESLSLTGLWKSCLEPMRVCVQRQFAGGFRGAAVFCRFLFALPGDFRGEGNDGRGNACASDDEEWGFAILGLFAGLLDFRNRCREIYFARGAAPFGGRGSAGL